MQTFELTACQIYGLSKPAFYSLIPSCEVNFVAGTSQIFADLKRVAKEQEKTKRRKLVALFLTYGSDEQKAKFFHWLNDYFNADMQISIFDLTAPVHPGIDNHYYPEPMLERALNNIKKSR